MGPIWTPKVQKIFKNHPKLAIFHIFWGLEPYHSYIESNFSLVHTWLSVPKIKLSFIGCLEKDIGSHLGSKGPKNLQKSPKIGYFSHILGIRAISPIHWIKFLFGTYMIECPKDKIIIHRVSGEGYGVPPGLQRAQKSSKITQNWLFFTYFGDWSHITHTLNQISH